MPKLIQNIIGDIVDNLKDTTHAIKFVESKFGYGDYFKLGCYEAFLQDLRKVIYTEDLNKTNDFGVAYNRDSEFKNINISETKRVLAAEAVCVPPTVFNGTYDNADEGGGLSTFDLDSTESSVAPFDYTTATFEWYEDIALTIPILTTSSYVSATALIYVKVITSPGCFSTTTLQLNVIL